MTHYDLTKLATRLCEHGKNVCCMCPRKTPSPTVAAYLAKAKRRYPDAVEYNPASDGKRWVEHPANGLRFVGKVHDLYRRDDVSARVNHHGWFIDSDQNETVCGVVYQLPARDGKPRFIYGVNDPWNDAAWLDFDYTDDINDAIRWADRMAERYAEDAREADEKDQAEQRVEAIAEEIKDLRTARRELLTEIKQNCGKLEGLAQIRAVLRAAVEGNKAECRTLAKERDELKGGL